MTEEEWLAASDPTPMLEFLRENASERKLRLSDCACGWHLEPWFPAPNVRKAIERAERYADGKLAKSTLRKWDLKVCDSAEAVYQMANSDPKAWMASHVVHLACLSHDMPHLRCGLSWLELGYQKLFFGPEADFFPPEWLQEAKRLALSSINDIFGNPFRPITIEPNCLTSTVLAIAKGIYDEKAFDRMPILADALQDAGCENEDILNHCRGEGVHVRGCWLVDLILGKA
jgi:hypothetical protein